MRHGLSLFLFAVLAASLALPQSSPAPAVPKKAQAVPAAKKAAPKTASIPKKTTSLKKTVTSKKGKASKKQVATASASRQMAPTPERYKEIQQALVEKGYLKSEPNGVWDTQSTDALRQFQTDKQLSATGKLSSASLIALGLGPKTAAASPVQPPAAVETPPAVPVPEN
jgi:peptidoglycan hydrolase-like protein with peptidoglycan-binding domain